MQILGELIILIAIVLSLLVGTFYNFLVGIITALSFLTLAFIVISLGEMASDLRDINNILRNVFPDKIPQDNEPSIAQKTCPACGDTHDVDFLRCPKCNYDYNIR